MNFKSHLRIAMDPEMRVQAHVHAVDFALRGEAALGLATGPIHAEVGVVPLRLTIPFLRRRGPVLVGSLGPFRVALRPVEAQAHVKTARIEGRIGGEEGIRADFLGEGKCRTDVAIDADTPVKSIRATVEAELDK